MDRAEIVACAAEGQPVLVQDFDLAGFDLAGLNLAGWRFHRCGMKGARWTRAILHGAVFEGSCLREAALTGARFEEADLRGADVGGLKLSDAARFRGATISRAQAADLLAELGLQVA